MAGRERFLSKVLVRNLPIGLDETAFKALVGESLLQNVDYFYYVPGKSKPKATDIPTMAFLNFTTQASLLEFNSKIDGHAFLDSKGLGVSCSVESSQSQLKPRRIGAGASNRQQPKPDLLQGTIEEDDHFKQFLAEISAPAVAPVADSEPPPVRVLTPLLLAIKQKDLAKFEERKNAQSKKKQKKNKIKTKVTAATAAAPTPNKATSNRNKNAKKNRTKKAGVEGGPQFGAVKIMTASAAGTSSSAAQPSSSSTPAASTPAEAKKRRQRRPKVKKTGNDAAPAKKTAQPAP